MVCHEPEAFSTDARMGTTTTIRTLVLVEGDSDAGAVRALADLVGCDLDLHHIQIWSADGVTNFSRVLAEFVRTHPGMFAAPLGRREESRCPVHLAIKH
jgi:hypothetical protein